MNYPTHHSLISLYCLWSLIASSEKKLRPVELQVMSNKGMSTINRLLEILVDNGMVTKAPFGHDRRIGYWANKNQRENLELFQNHLEAGKHLAGHLKLSDPGMIGLITTYEFEAVQPKPQLNPSKSKQRKTSKTHRPKAGRDLIWNGERFKGLE